jgi:uncharacterized protein YacL (UPF0231 family)
MWDWTLFFPELVATVIGVGLGVPLGLWLNRRASELQRRQEEKRIKQRKLRLLKALQKEVEHDQELLNQLEGELKTGKVPLYSLDTDMWEFVGGQVAEAISSEEILTRTSSLYFEFDHMKRKIDALFQLYANPTMSASSLWQQRLTALSGSMLVHLPPTKKLCKEVLNLLKDEVKKQES